MKKRKRQHVEDRQVRTRDQKRRETRSGRRIRRYVRRMAGIRVKAEDVGSGETVGRRKATVQVKIRQQLDWTSAERKTVHVADGSIPICNKVFSGYII